MTKNEFCEKANIDFNSLNDDDYKIIEYVYMFHPIIDPIAGKQQIADIYNMSGGMRILRDMVQTAVDAEGLEKRMSGMRTKINDMRNMLGDLQREYDKLKG